MNDGGGGARLISYGSCRGNSSTPPGMLHPTTYYCDGNSLYFQNDASCGSRLIEQCTYGCSLGACLPNGDVCPNIAGVQSSIPAGYELVNGQCLPECPAGHTRQGTQCIPPQCSQPPICSSDFKRVLNACTGGTAQTCTSSQTCISGQCVNISATLTVNPNLVKSGKTTMVTWSGTNVSSCTVTEDNPNITDAWSCNSTASCAATHTQTSGEIDQETIYTLVCSARSGATVTKTATVHVIFDWKEP